MLKCIHASRTCSQANFPPPPQKVPVVLYYDLLTMKYSLTYGITCNHKISNLFAHSLQLMFTVWFICVAIILVVLSHTGLSHCFSTSFSVKYYYIGRG